jgi:hypothetical protein
MTTWSLDDFGLAPEDQGSSTVTVKLPKATKATPEQEERARPRTPSERFRDAYIAAALHNPMGAEGALRYLGIGRPKGMTDAQLNRIERRMADEFARKQNADPVFQGGDPRQSVVRGGLDLLGSFLGGVDPTYLIAPGRNAVERIAAQSGVNAGQDSAAQLIEQHRGVRDNFDPNEVILNAAVGAGGQGTAELVRHTRLQQRVRDGSAHPDWKAVNDVIVNDLEGGGTIAHPNVSKKGAMGPQQVMMATARHPGFGINPWDGKSQEDLARVGREYSAAMMSKYNGDAKKVLAAYNGGPGRVDRLIAKHGDNWLSFMPDETKRYVHNGLRRMQQGPDDLGESNLVRGEQPHPDEQATINQHLQPSEELDNLVPQENVDTSFTGRRVEQLGSENDATITQNLDFANRIHKGIDQGLITDQHLPNVQSARDNVAGILNDFGDDLHPDQKERVQENLDLLDHALERIRNTAASPSDVEFLGGPSITEKPGPFDSSHEKFTGYPKDNSPANDVYGQVDDIHKTLHEYTDKEWRRLPKTWQDKLVRDANEKLFSPPPGKTLHEYTDEEWGKLTQPQKDKLVADANEKLFNLERDRNPPAASSSAGTRPPKGINERPTPKSPEGHDDLKSVKTEKRLVLDKLGDLLDQSTPIRREAEAAIAKERAQRLAKVYAVRKKETGESGFYQELAALKGSMGRPKIQSIRGQFTKAEIDTMYDVINNSNLLEGYETIRAKAALNKLLGADYGEIPTASEVALLAKAMPAKASMWRRLLENEQGYLNLDLPDGAIKRNVVNVFGLPRTLKASFDFSAPFRQGMFLVGRKEFWKAMPGMFKAFFSKKAFDDIQDDVFNRPTYDLMNRAGLQTTKNNAGLIDREEAFVSQFAEKIPGVRHSERAYLAFLNKLRADVFDDFVRKGEKLGIDPVQDPEYLKSAARFINAATGRGTIKIMSRNAQILSNVLFSPKLMASRLQLLNPKFYTDLHPAVRKEAAKSGLIYAGTVLSVLGLAAAAGADVEMDPRSTDFAKIKVGNTRFDVTGGFQPYVRFYAQFLTGQQKGIKDDVVRNVGWAPAIMRKYLPGEEQGKFKPTTRKDVVYRFLENKESPNANEVTRLLQGSDMVGQPLTLGSEVSNLFAPLIVSDTWNAYKDLGPKGLLTAIPNTVGVGVATYTPAPKKASNKIPGINPSDFGFDAKEFGDKSWSMKDFQ